MSRQLLATLLFCAPLLPAGAFYSTTVSSEFLIGPGVAVVAGPSLPTITEFGGGAAFAAGVVSPAGVLPATSAIGVSGFAPAPVSLASSSFQSGHIFTIDNSAGDVPVFLAFTFSYGYDVDLGAATPFQDYAEGGAFFHISGIDNEVLTIAGVPVAEFLFNPTFDTLLGGVGGTGGGFVTGGIAVPAFTVSVFSVITDTAGLAYSIPEPATAALVSLAAACFAVFRPRRR